MLITANRMKNKNLKLPGKTIMDFASAKFDFVTENQTIIIAEVGVNHNSDLNTAKKMVRVAKDTEVDIIKFQLFDSSKEISILAEKADYQKSKRKGKDVETQLEMCSALELSREDIRKLKNYCAKLNMPFLCSVFEEYSLDYLVDILGVKTIKIPSGEISNLPFLRQIGKKRVSAILSTGASNLTEVETAINTLKNSGCNNLILLHCVSQYPAPIEQTNLRAIETLRKTFRIPVGFSDHTIGIEADIAAAALGACAIEKHFTLDKKMPGPDHKASIEPSELKTMVKAVRNINQALGDGIKKPATCEEPNIPLIRKSIVAAYDLKIGIKLAKDMLAIKRPLGGVEPAYLDLILGRSTKRYIKKDELIHWDDLK